MKIKISEIAARRRIERALQSDLLLRKVQGSYYLINTKKGEVIKQITLESYGREINVLDAWEEVE